MNKLLAIVLVCIVCLTLPVCGNGKTLDANVQSELSQKIESFFDKNNVKKILDDKKISEVLSDMMEKASHREIEIFENKLKEYGIILDKKIFEDAGKTYNWLAEVINMFVKKAIKTGELTTEQLKKLSFLKFFGITIPDIDIKEAMSDEEIEKLSIAVVEFVDKISESKALNLFGIRLEDPELFDKIKIEIAERVLE